MTEMSDEEVVEDDEWSDQNEDEEDETKDAPSIKTKTKHESLADHTWPCWHCGLAVNALVSTQTCPECKASRLMQWYCESCAQPNYRGSIAGHLYVLFPPDESGHCEIHPSIYGGEPGGDGWEKRVETWERQTEREMDQKKRRLLADEFLLFTAHMPQKEEKEEKEKEKETPEFEIAYMHGRIRFPHYAAQTIPMIEFMMHARRLWPAFFQVLSECIFCHKLLLTAKPTSPHNNNILLHWCILLENAGLDHHHYVVRRPIFRFCGALVEQVHKLASELLSQKDARGQTPIHYALRCPSGCLPMLSYLLDNATLDQLCWTTAPILTEDWRNGPRGLKEQIDPLNKGLNFVETLFVLMEIYSNNYEWWVRRICDLVRRGVPWNGLTNNLFTFDKEQLALNIERGSFIRKKALRLTFLMGVYGKKETQTALAQFPLFERHVLPIIFKFAEDATKA